MQRWCTKLRSLSVSSSSSLSKPNHAPPWRFRLLHSSTSPISRSPFQFSSAIPPAIKPLGSSFAHSSARLSLSHVLISSHLPSSFSAQVRSFSARMKRKKNKPKPYFRTPTVGKRKSRKMKTPSAYKLRFRLNKDGTIMRRRAGTRHNAHSKSKSQKRRLGKATIVAPGYAKVMKKLGFNIK